MRTIAVIVGTVPEAVKLAPICRSLATHEASVRTEVILSGQHQDRVGLILNLFDVSANCDLSKRITRRSLAAMAASVLDAIADTLDQLRPDMVIVQGDTVTALMGAMAAFYLGVPVAHVEAGLTTGNVAHPFPEELHRAVISKLAMLLFAPSEVAAIHARSMARPAARVFVTGNPVVDALVRMTETRMIPALQRRDKPVRKMVLVTVHRRENHGPRGIRIGEALKRLAQDRPDAEVVFVGHTHPGLAPIAEFLGQGGQVDVLPPQDYLDWLGLLCKCQFVISDSGGAQEEAPWLNKPVLVLRDETERPEVVETGAAKLVGTDPEYIYRAAVELLDDPLVDRRMQIARKRYPYGNGTAASQIAGHVVEFLRTVEPDHGALDGADFRLCLRFIEPTPTTRSPATELHVENV